MINKTTEAAFRILVHLLTRKDKGVVSVQSLAEEIGGSSTYLAKVANHLVRGGILIGRRGIRGGLELAPNASAVPLLKVVELCQGLPTAAYCDSKATSGTKICGYHKVMLDLHRAVHEILGKKKIGDLAACPFGAAPDSKPLRLCRMNHPESNLANSGAEAPVKGKGRIRV